MSIMVLEGCRNVTAALLQKKYIDAQANWTFPATGGRGNTKCMAGTGNGVNLDMYADSGTSNKIVIGFWMKILVGLPTSNSQIVTFWDHDQSSSFPQCSFYIRTDGNIQFTRSSLTNLLTTTTPVIAADTEYFVEIECFTANSPDGYMRLWLNNALAAEVTGVDTQQFTNPGISDVELACTNGRQMNVNDLYVINRDGSAPFNERFGLWQIDSLSPDGDGATNNMTAVGAGSTNADRQDDETADDDTTYVHSVTAGDTELYTFDNLPAFTGSSVQAVQVNWVAKKDVAGETRQAHAITRPVSTIYHGANKGLPAIDYQHFNERWINNPETAALWTEAEINASQFGVELDV